MFYLTQCKETKNLEKRYEKKFEEMMTRMDNLEGNMNELKELKNTTQELCEAYASSKAKSTKQKKGYQRLNINSMK